MIKDKEGYWFTKNNIIGNDIQLTITIPKPDWKCFDVDSRAVLVSKDGVIITKKVKSIGGGKQRILVIPKEDSDIFSKGDLVQIYPLYIEGKLNYDMKVSKSQ